MASESDARSNSLASLDFSREAMSKAVLKSVASSPLVTVPTAVGVVGVAAFVAGAAFPPLLVYLSIAGGLGFGSAWLAFNFFVRGDTLAVRYLQQLSLNSRVQAEKLANELREEFARLEHPHAIELIDLLQNHLETIGRLLEDKFDKNDVSYEQFFTPAQLLYEQTLNLLKDASTQLEANLTYDKSYERRTKGARPGAARRQELYAEGTKRFETLIESAESSITGLAELAHDVAKIGGKNAQSHANYIKQVQDIASRAGLFVDQKRI